MKKFNFFYAFPLLLILFSGFACGSDVDDESYYEGAELPHLYWECKNLDVDSVHPHFSVPNSGGQYVLRCSNGAPLVVSFLVNEVDSVFRGFEYDCYRSSNAVRPRFSNEICNWFLVSENTHGSEYRVVVEHNSGKPRKVLVGFVDGLSTGTVTFVQAGTE